VVAKTTEPAPLPGIIGVWKAATKPLEEQDQDRSKIGSWSSAGWASPSSCGLWGGDALLLSTGAAEIETLPHGANEHTNNRDCRARRS
jgi:hypothetical protein